LGFGWRIISGGGEGVGEEAAAGSAAAAAAAAAAAVWWLGNSVEADRGGSAWQTGAGYFRFSRRNPNSLIQVAHSQQWSLS